MSVVIVGGNECMVRQYKDLCSKYRCKAKIYPKMCACMKDLGRPNLLILFTNTVSHKMVHSALIDSRQKNIKVARSHSSSLSALKGILEEHFPCEA